MRRAFTLSEEDEECLVAAGRPWEAVIEGGVKWLLFPVYPIPEGYNHRAVTAALRVSPSYPDAEFDMFNFCPSLALTTGRTIGALTQFSLDGRMFQQWSRHRTATNPWRPGVDNIGTHLLLADSWLSRELKG